MSLLQLLFFQHNGVTEQGEETGFTSITSDGWWLICLTWTCPFSEARSSENQMKESVASYRWGYQHIQSRNIINCLVKGSQLPLENFVFLFFFSFLFLISFFSILIVMCTMYNKVGQEVFQLRTSGSEVGGRAALDIAVV